MSYRSCCCRYLRMKFLVLCLLVGIAYGEVSTRVTVTKDAIEASSGASAVLPCEFEMLNNGDQPPIIYWIKGVSVDDPAAVVMFKGYRYWNESLGEFRKFYGDYEKRATVPDLDEPSIKLTGLSSDDEGRYWCMVAEWSGRQQEGTDADSVALMIDGKKSYVDAYTNMYNTTVETGEDTTLPCYGKGTFNSVTWYEGPFHNSDQENFTHTEIGTYNNLGSFVHACNTNGCVVGENMHPEYPNLSIRSDNSLVVSGAVVQDSGRYWCEIANQGGNNVELETDRRSIQLTVKGETFLCSEHAPGLYTDEEDCSKYYECVSGDSRTYSRSCGYDGLVFDERYGYCDWAANVPPPCGTNSG